MLKQCIRVRFSEAVFCALISELLAFLGSFHSTLQDKCNWAKTYLNKSQLQSQRDRDRLGGGGGERERERERLIDRLIDWLISGSPNKHVYASHWPWLAYLPIFELITLGKGLVPRFIYTSESLLMEKITKRGKGKRNGKRVVLVDSYHFQEG